MSVPSSVLALLAATVALFPAAPRHANVAMSQVDRNPPVWFVTAQPSRSFGYKTGWIAVRSQDRDAVVRALGLVDARRDTWRSGLQNASGTHAVAVTAPIEGWVLVVGMILAERIDPELVERLSTEFGEVQYFATHRVSEYHVWLRLVGGELVRAFRFADGAAEQGGDPTPVELPILGRRRMGLLVIDESDVMAVAGAWSVDPSTLDEPRYDPLESAGLVVGRLASPQ